ncbi:PAS domain S-box protein [Siphonobacter sp.]|uniref:PAS domain S-box protein n=1 Tax=Siphonobacter sp. TaxID=1869184 RepID=UPI003B3B90ED
MSKTLSTEAGPSLRQTSPGLPLSSASSELQDLIRNTTDLIQMIDLQGRFLYVNKAWKDTIGYRSAELNQMNLRDVIHPEFMEETLSKFERVKNGEQIPDFEAVYRRKDGRRVYLSGSVNCRYDEQGKPIVFRCIFHDATAKNRAENAQNLYYQIANSTLSTRSLDDLYHFIHEELGKVIDTKNFFISLYDPTKSYLYFPYYVDEYFNKNIRFTKRKLGNGLTEYAIVANRPLMLTENEILDLARQRVLYIYGEIPKVMLCVPLRIGDRITGIIGVKSYERANKYDIRDLELLEFISGQVAVAIERKQAEAELGKQTARLHAIFESSSHLMWTVNRRLQLTSFNDNYMKLIQSQLNMPPQVNVTTDQFAWRLMDSSNRKIMEEKYKIAFRGKAESYEVHMEHIRHGDDIWLEVYLNPILLADGTIEEVAGIARDITPLKRSARELLKAKEEAERSLKVKERFLANMSHEIRTPMNGVIGMIDLLSTTRLEEEQREYVHTIKKSSETLLNILNDILDLSKIEAGKMVLHEAPFEFRSVFDKLISLFGQTAKNRNNTLTYELGADLPQYIIADETRLLQILSNLTSNALKFTEQGSVKVRVMNLTTHGKWHKIRVEVEDSGIGISEDGLKQLFGAFQQLDNTTRKSFGGTGLGLAISRELSRLMKGEMGVESEVGQGSTFWFTVELKETMIAPLQEKKYADEFQIVGYLAKEQPHILLVDDNAVNRKVASEILLKAGCRVETADSGRKAIQLVEQTIGTDPYSLILMDIQMPDMDGLETTQALRKQFAEALPPILAMTAYSMKEDRERFLSQGMNDYVSKPIRAEILVLKVKEWVDRVGIEKAKTNAATAVPEPLVPKPPVTNELSDLYDFGVVNQLAELAGKEMVEQVFAEFEQEATEQIAAAKEGFASEDFQMVESNLHTLKGNAGTLGITRLHEVVKTLELKTKVGNFSTFTTEFPPIETEFTHFKETYAQVLQGLK